MVIEKIRKAAERKSVGSYRQELCHHFKISCQAGRQGVSPSGSRYRNNTDHANTTGELVKLMLSSLRRPGNVVQLSRRLHGWFQIDPDETRAARAMISCSRLKQVITGGMIAAQPSIDAGYFPGENNRSVGRNDDDRKELSKIYGG